MYPSCNGCPAACARKPVAKDTQDSQVRPRAQLGNSLALHRVSPSLVATCSGSIEAAQSSNEVAMNIHLTMGPIVSLAAGILILLMPKLLNYIVAIYLIIIGLLGLGLFGLH
jgi:hypothetical protein